MPSAASVKIDKQISSENASTDSSQNLTPLRQAVTIIEHKIRNLEKRKSKLESYKELQNAGKELNSDQKTAVAKFNEVISTLDFARDLCKQFLGIAAVSEKEAKKLAKKEATAKYQAELARLREILLVQDALNQMGNENVREDFLQGRNGAAQLSETDLKLLDDLYPAVTPKHEAGNPTAFTNEVQAAAEHLLAVVDGKPKDVFEGSYGQIKEVLGKIHESGYFDQAQVYESYVETEAMVEAEVVLVEPLPPQEVVQQQQQMEQPQPHGMPIIDSLTIEARPVIHQQPQMVPVDPQIALEQQLPPEQIYYQQVPQQMQQQPPRPITEMLGTGSFFFLQESEIDPPEQIPSQTFTNQNFGSMPPHAVPLANHYVAMPNNLPPPAGLQVAPPQPQTGNNGLDESRMQLPEEQPTHKDGNRGPANANAPYYHNNNNGYNNRPRLPNQNRNGQRPNSNRQN